jgi:hypothetical protein
VTCRRERGGASRSIQSGSTLLPIAGLLPPPKISFVVKAFFSQEQYVSLLFDLFSHRNKSAIYTNEYSEAALTVEAFKN